MTIGTKSVLFGAHQFLIHPWFVARAWWTLYGFPCDPRLWLAFVLHDVGYLGKPNMDGPEGETHPLVGAFLMLLLCGDAWHDFTLLHSRYYAQRVGRKYSRLCVADKLAIALTPAWLYLPLVRATGEIAEYRAHATSRYGRPASDSDEAWYADVQATSRAWALAHRDGAEDTWTSDRVRAARRPAATTRHTMAVWR